MKQVICPDAKRCCVRECDHNELHDYSVDCDTKCTLTTYDSVCAPEPPKHSGSIQAVRKGDGWIIITDAGTDWPSGRWYADHASALAAIGRYLHRI